MLYLGGDKGWVRKELIPTAEGDPVPPPGERGRGRGRADPNAPPRKNNGISGDARRSTVALGKQAFDIKVDYAVKQIHRLPRQPAEEHDTATVQSAIAGLQEVGIAGRKGASPSRLPFLQLLQSCNPVHLLIVGGTRDRRIAARAHSAAHTGRAIDADRVALRPADARSPRRCAGA